jgi:hypothetical protein
MTASRQSRDGAKPAEIPAQQPSKFELAINLNISKGMLGLLWAVQRKFGISST